MLSKESFKKNFVGCCAAKGITVDEMAQRFVYDAIKDRFEDAEFESITKDVFLSENFYGKMPDISLWTKRKKAKKEAVEQDSLQKAKQAFIEKVMDIVNTDYVPHDWKEDFRKSLTPTEAATMATLGDISLLWGSVRVNGNFDDVKAEYLVRRLGGEFEKNFRPERDSRLMIGVVPDEEMKKKVELLLKGVFS